MLFLEFELSSKWIGGVNFGFGFILFLEFERESIKLSRILEHQQINAALFLERNQTMLTDIHKLSRKLIHQKLMNYLYTHISSFLKSLFKQSCKLQHTKEYRQNEEHSRN